MSAEPLLRRIVATVGLLNLGYFFVEFAVALRIGSVSLFADSADFFEDASINFLIFVALKWSAKARSRVGMLLAGVLLLPALAFLWALWTKITAPLAPASIPLGLTGTGALLINLSCALMLSRFPGERRRQSHESRIFISAQRRAREYRDHCCSVADNTTRVRVAGHRSRLCHRLHECRGRDRSLASGS